MKKPLNILILYAAFIALMLLYWASYHFAPDFHVRVICGEDHVLEWITFLGFLSASVIGFCMLSWRRYMGKYTRIYIILLSVFFFVCAGEELSWGQRQIGFKTPDKVEVFNEQAEFNIHNIEFEKFRYLNFIHPKDIVSWFMKLFGIFVPIVLWFFYRDPDSPVWRYIPPPALIPCFMIPEVITLRQDSVFDFALARYGEAARDLWKLQAEESMEMFWGLCALAAMLALCNAWKQYVHSR